MAMKSHNKSEVIGMVVGVLISVLVMTLVSVSKEGLKPPGRASLVVFLAAFALWVTEPTRMFWHCGSSRDSSNCRLS